MSSSGATARTCPEDTGAAGALRFGGTEDAELFARECAESLRGTLELSFVQGPGTAYPPGFVHASPPRQYWSGTSWSRDTGAFLRELVLWGLLPQARLTAGFLMDAVPLAADGFASFPEYFRGNEERTPYETEHDHAYHPATSDELDGTAAVLAALALLWRRLPDRDPVRERVEAFLLGPTSPLRGFHLRLQSAPLLSGRGEFGGGSGPEAYLNVVQNYLAAIALDACALIAAARDAAEEAAAWKADAADIRQNMLRYLVDGEGCWLWCIDPQTLIADPEVLNAPGIRGFTGVNAVASLYADWYGLEPLLADWRGIERCRSTFERQLELPDRREQFERHGLWMQVDDRPTGLYCTPSYSGGYALQTMLLYEMPERAARLAGWLAQTTYRAEERGILFTNFSTGRISPWYFFERYCSPDAAGVLDMLAGCGPLNLVNVAEPLKAARLMLGVDDSRAGTVRIIPRLPSGWTSLEASDWPILTGEGVARADISLSQERGRVRFRLRVRDGSIAELAVRLPADRGFRWVRRRRVREMDA